MSTRAAPRLPLVKFIEERSRAQRAAAAVAASAFILWLSLRAAARTLLDRWWLDTLTDAPVWSRRISAELQIGVAAALLVAVVLGGSVWLALRTADADHGARHRLWQRYDERVGPAHRWALVALAIYVTWHAGRVAAGEWQAWLLFRHGGDLGVEVPEIGGDLGFHLFRLPFLVTVSSFVRQLLVISIAVSTFAHLASGALRLPGRGRQSSPTAVAHLGLLTVLLLAAQATHDVAIARSQTATDRVGTFDGPGFTEIEVTRPALTIAALALVAVGFTVVHGVRTSRWRGAAVAAVTATAVHLIALTIAPVATERLLVAPAEADRQLWSIEHNLRATRLAYGLDEIGSTDISLREGVDVEQLRAAPNGGEARIALFDTEQLARSLQVLSGTPGTRIGDVDLLPYPAEDGDRPVYVAARSASRGDLPERGWVQEHLVFTHGDGAVVLAADVAAADGRPDLSPPAEVAGAADVAHTPLYFGEGLQDWYAIVGTNRAEAGGRRYEGAGVAVGSTFRRLVVSLATGDVEPTLSSELGSDALLLFRRSLTERLGGLAPFLTLDSDPYLVVTEDAAVWVVDGYTTSATYPYAQFLPTNAGSGTSFAGREVNYVRASVKATVDSVDGTVHLYRTDGGTDPVVDVWDRVLPGLFDDSTELPQEISAHLRYPNDLFTVQTAMLGRYHGDEAEQLFNGTDRWAISPAASTTVGEPAPGPARTVDAVVTGGLSATRVFSPGASDNPGSTRDDLAGIAVAHHGGDSRLEILVASSTVLGSQVAQSAIDADPTLAQAITLLNANGSHVEFGPMTPILVGDGLGWARPITVVGTSSVSVPRLYAVAVVSDGLVGLGPTIVEALEATTGRRAAP